MDTLITIGKIINVRGLQGELKIASLTDFPLLRYRKGNTVYLEKNGQYVPLIVKQARHEPGLDFIQFQDHLDINLVQGWMGLFLYAKKDEIRLKAGNFYHEDLIGMTITTDTNLIVGKVSAIERMANRALLRMQREGNSDVLIPFIEPFIVDVNLESKVICVRFVEGML
jgi:16S rRNA processing protein RimM